MKFDRDTAILRFDDVTTSNKVNYWSQVIIDNLTHVKECSIFSSEFSFYFIFLSSKTTKLWNLRTSCYSGRRYRRSLLYLRHVLLAGSTKTRQILNLIYSAISRPIWTNFFFNLPIFSRRIQFFTLNVIWSDSIHISTIFGGTIFIKIYFLMYRKPDVQEYKWFFNGYLRSLSHVHYWLTKSPEPSRLVRRVT